MAANSGSSGTTKVERGVEAIKRGKLNPVVHRGQERAFDRVEQDCVRYKEES